jgi:hypothetical protein
MYHVGPRPYPRLTPEQMERILRELARHLPTMDRYRLAQRRPVAPQGEQLELFPAGRLDV